MIATMKESTKEKILVVNDDEGIRAVMQSVLDENGYETFEASNGRIGIEQTIKQMPDLILLDIMMPEVDGFEACSELKMNPTTKNIPVIFLSSLTNPKDKIKGLELGAVDFINNAMDKGELLARVQTQLKIKSLTQALRESNQQLIRKQESLDQDLQAAATIQRSFLPSINLELSNLELAWSWVPSNLLGGDIFNVIRLDESKFIIYMVDVSGHDVPSALVTVSVSQFLNQLNAPSNVFISPHQSLNELDKEYPIERFDRYFTIFYLVLDVYNGQLSYSCAGHPPAVLLKKDQKFKLLDQGGPIIGFNNGYTFEEMIETLSKGDKLFLYTDGVTDVKNKQGERFGNERLYPLLEKIKKKPIKEIAGDIQLALNEFSEGVRFPDDISFLGFEYK